MGHFIEPTELQRLTDNIALQTMDQTVLDEMYIWPAEKRIEQRYYLNLDTNYDPAHWVGTFTVRPRQRTQFQSDYKRATLALVNYWAGNPRHLQTEAIGGATATYGPFMPPTVGVFMHKWAKQPKVVRM